MKTFSAAKMAGQASKLAQRATTHLQALIAQYCPIRWTEKGPKRVDTHHQMG